MNSSVLLYIVLSVFGIILIYFSYRGNRMGWFRYLFLMISIQATRDLGLSPLFAELMNIPSYSFELIQRAHGGNEFKALALIGVYYFSLGVGIWLVYLFVGARVIKNNNQYDGISPACYYNDIKLQKGYFFAAFLALIGLLANVAVVVLLLPEYNIFEIASSRAVFSTTLNFTDYRYSYLRLLSTLLQVGCLGMVCLSKGRGRRYGIAITIAILQIFFEVLYGGRGRMIQGIILLGLANHLVHPIRLRRVFLYTLAAFLMIMIIGSIRSDVKGIKNLIFYSTKSFAMQDYTRVDDTACILEIFPDRIPFTGWLNFVGSAVRVIPTVALPGTDSLYGYLVDHLYGGINPSAGIGGFNFSTAAELYSWGGVRMVIFFGIVYGSIFAFLLAWIIRYRFSIPVILFGMILFIKLFFLGISSRLPDSLGGIFMIFVPLSMLASVISPSRYKPFLYLVIIFDVFMFYFMNIVRGSDAMKIPKMCVLVTIPLLYYICIRLMRNSSVHFCINSTRNVSDSRWPR